VTGALVRSGGGEIGASTAGPGRPEDRVDEAASACAIAAITLVVAAGCAGVWAAPQ
jgi:hypothetical protein